ncbi:hypothetical protein IGB42_01583 [Andreprevotia sp. IGB-42]|uniref:hypothetical protein n=1 Tax=Andreprevotia sp. IGB-42 TaxID=2497473 RepID=UPI0013577C40|nr:hypothetical protein [Andreprevotia sp. IGB-42]KAF0813904.1 hypothetical protein IGB42_01583 [Andreprevotia sp. IGB-42]
MKRLFRNILSSSLFLLSVSGVIVTQGCASVEDPRAVAAKNDPAFFTWYMQLAKEIQADPEYRKLPLDTDEQANEFVQWLQDTYNHKRSVEDFSNWANSRYPGHQYEMTFITERLPR